MIGTVSGQYASSGYVVSGFDVINRINFGSYHTSSAHYTVSLFIGKATSSTVKFFVYENNTDIIVAKYNFEEV